MNGARGNSGVILSQILRGIAEVTATAAAASGAVLAGGRRQRPSGPRCGAASSWSSRRWVAWR
ncbi:hypothetical protein TMLG_01473, partial [Mycobacterium tuberculosis SUMu012]